MGRKSLDTDTTGTTAKLEVRVPDSLRADVQRVLADKETQSEFVRAAMTREVNRREKRTAGRTA